MSDDFTWSVDIKYESFRLRLKKDGRVFVNNGYHGQWRVGKDCLELSHKNAAGWVPLMTSEKESRQLWQRYHEWLSYRTKDLADLITK